MMAINFHKTEPAGSGGVLQHVHVAEVGNIYLIFKADLEQIGPFLHLNFPIVHNDFYHEVSLLVSYSFTGRRF